MVSAHNTGVREQSGEEEPGRLITAMELSGGRLGELNTHRHQLTLANDLLYLRTLRGLTQRELAFRAGVQQAEISKIERGLVSPTSRTLGKLADALQAEVRVLSRRVSPPVGAELPA